MRCGSVASDGVRIEAKKTGDTPAKLHPSEEHEFAWRSLSLDKLLCNVFNQSHINKPAPPPGPWEPSQ